MARSNGVVTRREHTSCATRGKIKENETKIREKERKGGNRNIENEQEENVKGLATRNRLEKGTRKRGAPSERRSLGRLYRLVIFFRFLEKPVSYRVSSELRIYVS